MKLNILHLLLLLCAGGFVFAAAAPQAGAVLNQGDLIWDAENWQGQVHLEAKYKESPENGFIDQELEVEIENLPPFTTVDVLLRGRKVGTMTTSAAGSARFDMVRLGVLPTASGRPNGPRLETGDLVTVRKGNASISAPFLPRP